MAVGEKKNTPSSTIALTSIFAVIDSGEGIPEDKLPLIWDRYYKENKAHKRASIGTGLGLSIVKGVIELHGGTYGVLSSEGKGSVFWFEIET